MLKLYIYFLANTTSCSFFCLLLLLLTFYVVYFDVILNVVLNKTIVLLNVCNDFAFMLPAVCKRTGYFLLCMGLIWLDVMVFLFFLGMIS